MNMKNAASVNAYEKELSPEGSHATNNHDGTNDTNTLVFGHSAGELFADHNVHVILRGERNK